MTESTMLYRCPGPHCAHAGQTYDYRAARTDEELASLRDQGWHLSLVEAVDAANGVEKDGEEEDESPPTRDEMEVMANRLGIKFDGRTNDAGLLKKIDAALADLPEEA